MGNQIEQMKNEILELTEELEKAEKDRLENEQNKNILSKLFDKNIIDANGNPI